MMAEWLKLVDRDSFLLGLLAGVIVAAVVTYWIMLRRHREAALSAQEERDGLRSALAERSTGSPWGIVKTLNRLAPLKRAATPSPRRLARSSAGNEVASGG